jgi:hypothetical protein
LDVVQGVERWIGATHGADLKGFIQRHERAADEGVLRLD